MEHLTIAVGVMAPQEMSPTTQFQGCEKRRAADIADGGVILRRRQRMGPYMA